MDEAAPDRFPYPRSLWSVGPILGAVAVFGLASGCLFPAVALRLSANGAADVQIGLITSAYFLGALAGSLTAGSVLRRLSRFHAFVVFAAVAAGGTAVLGATDSLAAWAGLRLVAGYGLGAYYVLVESWLNRNVPNARRGRILAVYETVRMTSIAIGPFISGFVSPQDAIAAAAVLFAAAILPIGLSRQSNSGAVAPQRRGAWRLPTGCLLGAFACMVAGVVSGSIYGLGAVYGQDIGLSPAHVSLFLSTTWIAPIATHFAVGAIGDRTGRLPVIAAVASAAACAALSVALLDGVHLPLLLILAFLTGGLSHPVYALGLALTNDRLDASAMVGAAGPLLVAYNLGTFFGPMLVAAVMDSFGPAGLYHVIAISLWLLAAWAAGSILSQRAPALKKP